MKEANPRSQLTSMKLRYFFTVVGMMIGLFMILLIPAEIVFMIFETEPYLTLLIVLLLFGFAAMIVYRLVNYRWIERWTRVEAEEPDPVIPEPEYVFDDEMAKRLLADSEKKKKPGFALFRRNKEPRKTEVKPEERTAPVSVNTDGTDKEPMTAKPVEEQGSDWKTLFEDQETIELSSAPLTSESDTDSSDSGEKPLLKKEPEDAPQKQKREQKKKQKQKQEQRGENSQSLKPGTETPSGSKAKKPESARRRKQEVPAPEPKPIEQSAPERESNWAVPFDELPTADLSALAQEHHKSASSSQRGEEETDGKPAKPEKKRRRGLFFREKEEMVLEVTSHPDGTSSSRTVTEKKKDSRRREKQKAQNEPAAEKKKPSEKTVRRKPKTKHSPDAVVENSHVKAPEQAASAWAVPFDEMPTEEMQKAVENALDGGYNPFSDDRNK